MKSKEAKSQRSLERKREYWAGILKLENMTRRIGGRPADQTKLGLMWAGTSITRFLSC